MAVLELYVDAGVHRASAGPQSVISASDLTKRYGQGDAHVDALRGVSLEIEEGRMTAVALDRRREAGAGHGWRSCWRPSGSPSGGPTGRRNCPGGQQQRVSIARALLPRPTVLFADEPTGNLDSRTSQDVLALLRGSVDALGQTIVTVTHDPHAAAQADRNDRR